MVKGCGVACMMTNPTEEVVDLIEKMLQYDPLKRISAIDCLKHSYFDDMDMVFAEIRRDRFIDEGYLKELEDVWLSTRHG